MTLLRETKKKMQKLIAFWKDCKLITDQRTSLSLQWSDSEVKVQRLKMSSYLKKWLNAIKTEFNRFTDKGLKLWMIEISHWTKAILNSELTHTASDTLFSQSLFNELNVIWQDHDWLKLKDIKDEMIIRICQWRKLKHSQCCEEGPCALLQLDSDVDSEEQVQKTSSVCSEQKNLFSKSASGSVMTSEEMRQFKKNYSEKHNVNLKSLKPRSQWQKTEEIGFDSKQRLLLDVIDFNSGLMLLMFYVISSKQWQHRMKSLRVSSNNIAEKHQRKCGKQLWKVMSSFSLHRRQTH